MWYVYLMLAPVLIVLIVFFMFNFLVKKVMKLEQASIVEIINENGKFIEVCILLMSFFVALFGYVAWKIDYDRELEFSAYKEMSRIVERREDYMRSIKPHDVTEFIVDDEYTLQKYISFQEMVFDAKMCYDANICNANFIDSYYCSSIFALKTKMLMDEIINHNNIWCNKVGRCERANEYIYGSRIMMETISDIKYICPNVDQEIFSKKRIEIIYDYANALPLLL
ncbi:hypothetical protein [Rhodospira trueperi]|uniref:Uncharacterized protein n=1 Tax=Rhodospira trueperi TaxID=69960 RepID=A0A1G7D2K9_9PROT|nr:hypothetical protein [Rhodospira trueperi]SDE45914.1 hypothetical protein SAMN05421720_10712 [Rhodospira trueperi]